MKEEERVEEAVEEAEPHIPLALIVVEAARALLSDVRERLVSRIVELNERLAREQVIYHGKDWIGRDTYVIVRAGPIGPIKHKRVIIQY